MNENKNHIFRTSYWYPSLANYTFLTSFLKLRPEEVELLADGITGDSAGEVISRLAAPMNMISGNCFVYADCVAPTDTERFKGKRGAVFSPESAWKYLAESEKVRAAAKNGDIEFLCVRPFRRMTQPREFRLFIYEGELKAMSQYWLVRHFRRLEGIKEEYWDKAKAFVDMLSWALPKQTVVIDVYFTSQGEILIIDLNPWGQDTKPLLMRDWNIDWTQEYGIRIIPPPVKIGGEVNVSF